MAKWAAFPHVGDFHFDAQSVATKWDRLHAGDAEPLPRDPQVLEAWCLFHNGEFQKAVEAGLRAGGDGITVANGVYFYALSTASFTAAKKLTVIK